MGGRSEQQASRAQGNLERTCLHSFGDRLEMYITSVPKVDSARGVKTKNKVCRSKPALGVEVLPFDQHPIYREYFKASGFLQYRHVTVQP